MTYVHDLDDLVDVVAEGDIRLNFMGDDAATLKQIIHGIGPSRIVHVALDLEGGYGDISEFLCAHCPRLRGISANQLLLSAALEHAHHALTLIRLMYFGGDDARLFELLGERKGVDTLAIESYFTLPPRLGDYLRLDKLKYFDLETVRDPEIEPVLDALSCCARLRALRLGYAHLLRPLLGCVGLLEMDLYQCTIEAGFRLPPTVVKLDLWCDDAIPPDSSFLVDSCVVDLGIHGEGGADPLRYCATARRMRKVGIFGPPGDLRTATIERIMYLEIYYILDDHVLAEIARALLMPGSILRTLKIFVGDLNVTDFKTALAHPACRLERLETPANPLGQAYMTRLRHLALHHPAPGTHLDRLPVELFRTIAKALT